MSEEEKEALNPKFAKMDFEDVKKYLWDMWGVTEEESAKRKTKPKKRNKD